MIEEVKNYWNRRPCNIRHSSKLVGTREYFDEVEDRKYFVEPHIPEKVFAEMKKYCGLETEIRVMLYSKWSWKVFWIVLTYGKGAFWRTGELVRTYSEAQTGCPVTYCYTFSDICCLMKDFKIVDIRKDHIFPYKIDKYINYEYEWVWYFHWMPTPLLRWLEHHLGWHTLVVAKPKEWVDE